jgi:hypothetical protein
MKIIKQPDFEWTKRHTCTNCTAELEVEKQDVTFTHYSGDMREPSYDTWTASCPICAHTITIKEDEIPKAVQVVIKRRGSFGNPMDR